MDFAKLKMSLPTEILLLIFSNLSDQHDLITCITVKKSWAIVVLRFFIYRYLCFDTFQLLKHLLHIFRETNRTRTFRLKGSDILELSSELDGKNFFFSAFNYALFIQSIDLSKLTPKGDITTTILNELLNHCVNLETLQLYNCYNVSGETFEVLAHRCRNIKHLYLAGMPQLHGYELSTLGQCAKLRHINLALCNHLSSRYIIEITKQCREITYVNLASMDIHSQDILAIVRNCGYNLTRLCLNELASFGFVTIEAINATLEQICSICSNLECLEISRLCKFTSEKLNVLDILYFPETLNILNISKSILSERTIAAIKCLRNLRSLDIRQTNITDLHTVLGNPDIILALYTSTVDYSILPPDSFPQNLPSLREFYFFGISRMGDSVIRNLATNCPDLHILDIRNCNDVSPKSLATFSQHKMTHLVIAGCANFSSWERMGAIALWMPDLKFLDVSRLSNINDNVVIELVDSLKNLEGLAVQSCPIENANVQARIRRLEECYNLENKRKEIW